jgi:hypothetical protein
MTLKIELSANTPEELNAMIGRLAESIGAVHGTAVTSPTPPIPSAQEMLEIINEALAEQGFIAVIQRRPEDMGDDVSEEVEEKTPKPKARVSKAKVKAAHVVAEKVEEEPEEEPVKKEDANAEDHAKALDILMIVYKSEVGKDRLAELRQRWGVERLSYIPEQDGSQLLADAWVIVDDLGMRQQIEEQSA